MSQYEGDPWVTEALKRHGLDREVRITAIRDRMSSELIEMEFAWIMRPQFPEGLGNSGT